MSSNLYIWFIDFPTATPMIYDCVKFEIKLIKLIISKKQQIMHQYNHFKTLDNM